MPRRRKPKGYYLDGFVNRSVLGAEGRLDMFVMCVNDKTKQVVQQLRDAGLEQEARSLERAAKQVAREQVKQLTQDALKTARNHVPIDTRELQRQHIKVEYTTDANGNPEGCVYVDGADHFGSRRRNPERASVLALYLNSPDRRLRRSRDNGPHSKGEKTNSWIRDAKRDFRSRFPAVIRKEV